MPFSSDTSPEARRVVIEILRRMTPQERLARAFDMSSFLRDLTMAGVARDFPDATESRRFEEFLRRWVGGADAERAIEARRSRGLPPNTG